MIELSRFKVRILDLVLYSVKNLQSWILKLIPDTWERDMTTENQELRKAGLKVTLPRVKILQILENSVNKHMSAEDVYKALIEADEDVGLATVYRVLTQFETAGLVMRHHFEGGHSVFELTPADHHDHIVCNKCGRVEEFYDEIIEAQQDKIAENYGFKITDHSMYLYGICGSCQKNDA